MWCRYSIITELESPTLVNKEGAGAKLQQEGTDEAIPIAMLLVS